MTTTANLTTAGRKALPGMKVLRNTTEKGTQSSATLHASYGVKASWGFTASGPMLPR